jgi:hypothetical protein
MEPILPFLRSLVRVEAVSLESSDIPVEKVHQKDNEPPLGEHPGNGSPSHFPKKQNRKVHFLSLDGSSTRPPIDRDLQSGIRQQQSIAAMIVAKEQVDALTASARPLLLSFWQFLTNLQESLENTSGYYNTVLLCATSISKDFTPTAVLATVHFIQQDVHILQQRLLAQKEDIPPHAPSLHLELRLAELIGQGIRYRLRVLFNQSPPRLSSMDVRYENRSMAYSKVNQLITMTHRMEHNELGCAADDGFLSALISRAFRRLYDYLGLEHMTSLEEENGVPTPPATFCTSSASQRALPTHARAIGDDVVTALDRDSILQDVEAATSFLKATYAARFLLDLFTAPGVATEVARMGGWSEVEFYFLLANRVSREMVEHEQLFVGIYS